MFDYTRYITPDKGYASRSALQIEIAAREQEKRLALLRDEEIAMRAPRVKTQESGSIVEFLAFLATPVRQLAAAGRRIFML